MQADRAQPGHGGEPDTAQRSARRAPERRTDGPLWAMAPRQINRAWLPAALRRLSFNVINAHERPVRMAVDPGRADAQDDAAGAERGKLSPLQRLLFGFPSLPHALVAYPVYSLLPAYYAANTRVTLVEIGAIAAASRIFDAVNDPVIGYLSDRTRTRFGGRKPWYFASIIFLLAGSFFLLTPPPDATIIYFALWSTVLYTGFTMFEVPRSAWSSEVTRDYMERSRLGAYVGWFNIAGSFTVYVIPIFISLFTGSSAVGESTMYGISFVYFVLMPLAIILAVRFVPKGVEVARKPVSFGSLVRTMWKCRPLLRFYTITALWGLGQGVFISSSFLFQTEYMNLDEQVPYIMITFFASGMIFMPVWSRILTTADRHRVWGVFVALSSMAGLVTLLLPRGPEAFIPILGLTLVRGFLGTPQNFLPGAVLSDVIDYDTLKSGSNKAGNLFAFQMLIIKITMALGGALAFFIFDLSGLRIGEPGTPSSDFGIITCYLLIPIVLHVAMAGLCWNFPITRKRHAIIQKRLAQRAQRASRDHEAAESRAALAG
jgi:Na+/melibiose symporter-like transporter